MYPALRQTVLDTTDVHELAGFYRELLGWRYRPGGAELNPDADWLVLVDPDGVKRLAFQLVGTLPAPSWPANEPIPQQLHLDMTVPTKAELESQHDRVLELGGKLLADRSDDPDEPLRTYADPAGHPFCIFVVE